MVLGPGGSGLPAFVAEQHGFFAKRGLNVTIKTEPNTSLYPSLIGSGQFEIADMPAPTFLTAIKQGIRISAIANEFNTSPNYPFETLLVPNDSPIKSLTDLRGKTVATPATNGNIWISFQYSLLKAGVSLDSVKGVVTTFPTIAANLKAGRVDAALGIPPFTQQIRNVGARIVSYPYQSIGATVDGQIFAANTAWANKNKSVLAEFRDALNDATAFMKAHHSEALQVLQKVTGMSADVVKSVPLPDYGDYAINLAQLKVWQNVLTKTTGDKGYKSLDLESHIIS